MAIRHYYAFDNDTTAKMQGNALNANNWDVLRTDSADSAFALERTVEAFEANCLAAESYRQAAGALLPRFDRANVTRIVSFGVGKGTLEWDLKHARPALGVYCADYTASALDALRTLFPACDGFIRFDMLQDDYGRLYDGLSQTEGRAALLYRLSTEFTAAQWRQIFQALWTANVQHVFFVPTELLTARLAVNEAVQLTKGLLRGRRPTMCGWMYRRAAFMRMWQGLYDTEEVAMPGDTCLFCLTKK